MGELQHRELRERYLREREEWPHDDQEARQRDLLEPGTKSTAPQPRTLELHHKALVFVSKLSVSENALSDWLASEKKQGQKSLCRSVVKPLEKTPTF